MITLKIWGGAGEHGRSCYVLSGEQSRVMLDCGIKKEDKGVYPLIVADEIPQLTAVLLSHAHEDHSMGLPLLYKYGYKGDIWTTRETSAQLNSYFTSWRRYVTERGGELPFEEEHIAAMTYRYIEDYGTPGESIEIGKDLSVKWGRSGHLLGSVWFSLDMEGQGIFFSGDYSSESQLLETDFPRETSFDLSIVDNAYGMDNDRQDAKLAQLEDTADRVLDAGGHLLLPVPTGGRSQDMLIWASEQLSNYTIIVERPIWQGLRTMMEHPQWLRAGAQKRIDAVLKVLDVLNSSKVIVPSNDDERMSLLEGDRPCIIFTGDGMMDSPRARWYYDKLSQSSSHANHAVILTGHASRGSFARTILEQDTSLSGCKVQHICYKVHQGLPDVMTMLSGLHSKQTLLVHAPKSETDLVVARLQAEGYDGLQSLQPGMELKLML